MKTARVFVTVVALLVASSAVAGIALKPGDIVVGTSGNGPASGGGLYAVNPVNETITPIVDDLFLNGVSSVIVDGNLDLLVGTHANNGYSTGGLYRVTPTTGVVTQIGSTEYFNGIGAMALKDDNTLIVGSTASTELGTGALYEIDLTTGASTQLGSQTFFNGIGGLAIDPISGNYIFGTAVNNPMASGLLYSYNPTTDIYQQIGTTGVDGAVGGLMIDGSGDVVIGSFSHATGGTGSLYKADLDGTDPGDPNPQPFGTASFFGGVGAIGPGFGSEYLVGSMANTDYGTGKIYEIDPATGAATELLSDEFFNGVTALATIDLQVDFTGGVDITIGTGATLDVAGKPDYYSTDFGANLNVGQLVAELAVDPAMSVRPGIAEENNQDGDVTLAAALDYDGIGDTRDLMLRASDDIWVQAPITDSSPGDDDALNLTFHAKNAYQWPGLPGTTGLVDIDATIDTRGGTFHASGIGFDNTGGPVTAGDITLEMTGEIVIGAPLDAAQTSITTTGGNVDIDAAVMTGDTTITASGDVLLDAALSTGELAITAANLTSGPAGSVSATGDITVTMTSSNVYFDAPVSGASLTSAGDDFTATASATLTTTAGDLDLGGHTGAISLGAQTTVAGDLLTGTTGAPAGTFTATAPLDVTGNLTMRHTGQVQLSGSVDAAEVDIATDGAVLVDQPLGDSAPVLGLTIDAASLTTSYTDASNNGAIQSAGPVALTLAAAADLAAPVSADSLTSSGTDFSTSADAPLIISESLDLSSHGGAVALGALTAVGGNVSIGTTTPAASLTTGAGGELDIDGSLTVALASGGDVELGAPVQAASITSSGDAFHGLAAAPVTTLAGNLDLSGHTGSIHLEAATNVAGDLLGGTIGSPAASLTTGPAATLAVDGDVTLVHAGALNLGASLEATNVTSSGTDFTSADEVTTIGSLDLIGHSGAIAIQGPIDVGADLSIAQGGSPAASLTTTPGSTIGVDGAMSYAVTGNVVLQDAVTVSTGNLSGSGADFNAGSSATLDVAGDLSLLHTGSLDFDAPVTAANMTTEGTSLTTTVSAPINVGTGSVQMTQTGAIDLGAAVTAGSLSVEHGGFDNTSAPLNIAGGDITIEDTSLPSAQQYDVTIGTDATSANFHSSGVDFDSLAADVTATTQFSLNHTGIVTLGDVTAGHMDLGPASEVYIGSFSTPSTVDVDSLDLGQVGELEIRDGSLLDVAGPFAQQSPTVVNIAGGTLRVEDLQSVVPDDFNWYFGTVEIDNDVLFAPGEPIAGILGDPMQVTAGRTLRVTGASVLYAPLVINGGEFSTGSIQNMPALDFQSGTLTLTRQDVVISDGEPFGATYTLGSGSRLNIETNLPDAAGTLTVAADGYLRLTGGWMEPEAGTTNHGQIALLSDETRLAGGTVTNHALLGGTGRVDADLDNTATGQLSVDSGDELNVMGAVTNAGEINAAGGKLLLQQTLANTGQIHARAGSTVRVFGTATNSSEISFLESTLDFDGQLTNQSTGTLTGQNGELHFDGGLTNEGAVEMTFGDTNLFGQITNSTGSIVVAGESNATFHGDVNNGGLIRVGEGSTAVFFGTVSGTGMFEGEGTVYFEGVNAPGNSPGVATMNIDVVLGSQNTLEMELAGPQPGEAYDQLHVGGDLTLDGTLAVSLLDGFTPAAGDRFDLLDWTSVAGQFSDVLLPPLGQGLSWDTSSLYATGEIGVVPEPATVLMLLLAAAAGAMIRRR